jgi:hypothetical protein
LGDIINSIAGGEKTKRMKGIANKKKLFGRSLSFKKVYFRVLDIYDPT